MTSSLIYGSFGRSSGVIGVVGGLLNRTGRLFMADGVCFGGVRISEGVREVLGLFWTPLLETDIGEGGVSSFFFPAGQFCSWKVTELFHINARPHPGLEHEYGFSPVCFREWTLRLAFLLKTRRQVGQVNDFSGSAGMARGGSVVAAAPEAIECEVQNCGRGKVRKRGCGGVRIGGCGQKKETDGTRGGDSCTG